MKSFNTDKKWFDEILQALFESNYEKVYKTACYFTNDRELAKDATQEAFTRAFRKINTL